MDTPRKIPKSQYPTRMLARGIDFTDFMKLQMRVDRGDDYVAVCEELADKAFQHALTELKADHKITARTFFMNAAALYRVAPYEIMAYTNEKVRIYHKELDAFARGIALYDHFTAEKVEIPFEGSAMVGWLMIPKDASPEIPVVITTGGITGFKEEIHHAVLPFLERGLAVLNLDGPGQGEAFHFHRCLLTNHNERAHEAVVDYLLERSDVGSKIALYGLCHGGTMMARSAAFLSHKIAACVCVGGASSSKEALGFSPAFLHIAGMRAGLLEAGDEAMKAFVAGFDLDGIAENITCPFLVVHNSPDPLIPSTNAQKLFDDARSTDKTFKLFRGIPDHNAHNDNTEATALIGDWLADRLVRKPRPAAEPHVSVKLVESLV